MIALLRILILFAILFGLFLFVMYAFSVFLMGTNSLSRRMDSDAEKLNGILREFIDGLVALDADELKLMSTSPISKDIKNGVSNFAKGVISTIYQEPIIAFAIKKYSKTGDIVLVAKTSEDRFQIRSVKETFKVFKNNHLIGTLNEDYNFYGLDGKSTILQIDKIKGSLTADVIKDKSSIAHLNLRNDDGQFESDRVFSLFHEFKPQMEESLVILGLFHVLIKPKLDI